MTTLERPDLDAADLGLPSLDVWMLDAACRTLDTALFFSDDLDDIGAAKRSCLGVPRAGGVSRRSGRPG